MMKLNAMEHFIGKNTEKRGGAGGNEICSKIGWKRESGMSHVSV